MPYLINERETILIYDCCTHRWYAWTSIPSHIKKFEKKGWQKTGAHEENGIEVDASFEAPKNAITIRDLTKPSGPPKNAFSPKQEQKRVEEV